MVIGLESVKIKSQKRSRMSFRENFTPQIFLATCMYTVYANKNLTLFMNNYNELNVHMIADVHTVLCVPLISTCVVYTLFCEVVVL